MTSSGSTASRARRRRQLAALHARRARARHETLGMIAEPRRVRPRLHPHDGAARTKPGQLDAPVFFKIFLSGSWAVGPFPSEEAHRLPPAPDPGRPRRRVGARAVLARRPGADRAAEPPCARHEAAGSASGSATTRPPIPTRRTPSWSSRRAAGATTRGGPVASAAEVRARFAPQRGLMEAPARSMDHRDPSPPPRSSRS